MPVTSAVSAFWSRQPTSRPNGSERGAEGRGGAAIPACPIRGWACSRRCVRLGTFYATKGVGRGLLVWSCQPWRVLCSRMAVVSGSNFAKGPARPLLSICRAMRRWKMRRRQPAAVRAGAPAKPMLVVEDEAASLDMAAEVLVCERLRCWRPFVAQLQAFTAAEHPRRNRLLSSPTSSCGR